ncbi:ACP S-malonyltransferase [Litoribrevibacter euphylliae]|uniref:Malonyl CoA-acyl carrier protein transacylase n=1 Tax=Litoribrevibacter euphylliae TaxID=1834034 RepID=A0ABV7HJT2_9GAMM
MAHAFIFPGQGSQSVGMGSDYFQDSAIFRNAMEEASDALKYDLWDLIVNNSDDKLSQTEYTQPALLAVSVAMFRVAMDRMGDEPVVLSGHSLGEYSALVAAESLSFQDALQVVQARGRYMQQAVPAGEGAMAAVLGLDQAAIEEICSGVDGVVEAANINAPGQIVIAGEKAAVQSVLPLLKDAGAKRAIELPVSVPSHCSLMKPAAERLKDLLADVAVSMPSIPVIHNVTANSAASEQEIRSLLVEQLFSPVRWVECVEAIKGYSVEGNAVDRLVECGAGNVLTGLAKRIDRALPCITMNSISSLDDLS